MSSLNVNRFCSTKQNGSSPSASENSYRLTTGANRWRRTKLSCWFGSIGGLIPVVVGLERAVDRHVDVRGLVGGELGEAHAERGEGQAGGRLGEAHAERVEVQAGAFLVEPLGQHVHALLVLVVAAEQLDLGDRLVRERVRHHEARVAGGVAEVQQAALREEDDRVPVGEAPLVDLRLDVDALDA